MRKALLSLLTVLTFLGSLVVHAPAAKAARIEELCDIRGVRPNQVIGYGLVVGLAGTGDTGQSRFTVQSVAAMLRRLGATIEPELIQTRNAAAVMVTATLPPFAQPGMRIDVTVSSLGNARSLGGGTLIQTPLLGANREVFAVAQGSILVGGYSAESVSGSSLQRNYPTTGRIPEGALVERPVVQNPVRDNAITFSLRDPSFITATRIAEAINNEVGEGTARAEDGGAVKVTVPEQERENAMALIAQIQVLNVNPDMPARVVIDGNSGTIVLGSTVRIAEVAVAQGGLTIEVNEQYSVSQPNPFGAGTTQVVPNSTITAGATPPAAGAPGADGAPPAEPPTVRMMPNSASLQDVVTALNALGAKPRDLIPIFQALRAAGALQARIEVQ